MEYGFVNDSIPKNRGTLIEVHIADLHFGAFNPKDQYEILQKQFIPKLLAIPSIDVISIDGDTFDHKVMCNSDAALYATRFIDDLVHIAINKNSTIIILGGTYSHDFDQLKLFYHYMSNSENNKVDLRVITNIQFENIKGARVLMIPEINGLDESIYRHFLFESGYYDEAFVHGTFEGSVYGNMVSGNSRLFTAKDFVYCRGLAVSGHVHKPGCFQGFYYYCGCPYRWKFGEEEDKGFLIIAHNLDTQIHYVQFMPIISARYDTIFLDQLISEDPKKICDYINNRRIKDGIDYIKVKIRFPIPGYNKTVINNYYRNNPAVTIEFVDTTVEENKKELTNSTESTYNYLFDNSISDFERFVRYVNESEGSEFITVESLSKLLYDSI